MGKSCHEFLQESTIKYGVPGIVQESTIKYGVPGIVVSPELSPELRNCQSLFVKTISAIDLDPDG
jgi:hypothetical protein